ncbi:unnamed protein product [Polarella glacialis]|uniref:Ribosomal protein S10 n=1 Tax=Polarella glacialis TaxID=89957 RepID=A0A813ET68_POLGL|nr:unnamed protein product [Polarella glacialis]|mmetsp:Transcript_17773/g.28486  ORF Transcript_17773/g.28486 Transcript_17773/m.28486 type:complete len:173 (+) Transcript_17773:65-583(+)
MALAEYNLATLRFVYTSKLKKELQFTIQNLRRTLEWSNESWPVPQRLPRRAWRVSYLKRPFKCKSTVRHYVFHDWRYQFTFRDVQDVQSTVSTVLGSMTPETSCVCNFNWHFPGAPAYAQLNAVGEARHRIRDLEQGLAAVQLKQSEEVERQKGWYGHSTHWATGLKRGPVG